uniref:Aminotransferase n=1 Tax=Discosia rubi TaxID=2502037 RepID=A0A6M6I3Y3_9PEZI|nr:aminotransferase [Discosia rubi]
MAIVDSFPPPPVSSIDWTNTQSLEFHEGKWTPPKFVTNPYLRIHGMAPSLNYGQQALEGFKAFRTPDGISLFRPDRNAARLQHSAEVLSMPPVPTNLFLQSCRAAVALNAGFMPPHESGGALYVRPLQFGISAMLPPSIADDYMFCVFVAPAPAGVHDGTQPIRALILDEFDRAAPRGTGHAKVGGNYAPVLRWGRQARSDGFGITLHLDSERQEYVTEFSTCAFIGVKGSDADDGEVMLVVPESSCVIDSVTSSSLQQIGRSYGWKVEKRRISFSELPTFDEVLGAGTGVAVTPIRSITRRRLTRQLSPGPRVVVEKESETINYIPDGQQSGGPVFQKLLTRLKAIQLGKTPDEFSWRFEVRAEDLEVEGENTQTNGLHLART